MPPFKEMLIKSDNDLIHVSLIVNENFSRMRNGGASRRNQKRRDV